MTVTISGRPACVQCSATRHAFERRGVNFRLVDISKDRQACSLVIQLGYRQVPVIVAGDLHWAGFRPDMINQVQ